jgi:hypothetical protein
MTELDMKTVARVLAASIGEDETATHTLLRGWSKDKTVRPSKIGDNTSPLYYSPRDVYRIGIILQVKRFFPKLKPDFTELLFSWTGAESKVTVSPDGTHTSYSLEGALVGIKKGHDWRIVINLENEFVPLRFMPVAKGVSLETSGAYLSLPANELLQSIERELEAAT